jgi:hypothetical protein
MERNRSRNSNPVAQQSARRGSAEADSLGEAGAGRRRRRRRRRREAADSHLSRCRRKHELLVVVVFRAAPSPWNGWIHLLQCSSELEIPRLPD